MGFFNIGAASNILKPPAMPIYTKGRVTCDYTAPTPTIWTASGLNVTEKVAPSSEGQKTWDFASILECPVCFSVPNMEIFNCEKGHSICGQCRKKLTTCVLCAGQYTQSRNFMMESMISYLAKNNILELDAGRMHVECIYKDDGCSKLLLPSEIEVHELDCECRPVQCIVESSSQCKPKPSLKISKYFQHLKDHHHIRGSSEASGMFTKIDRLFTEWNINVTWPPYYLQYDGKTFLRCAAIKNRNVSIWVQLIGQDGEADNYQAVVSLSSPSKKDGTEFHPGKVVARRLHGTNSRHSLVSYNSLFTLNRYGVARARTFNLLELEIGYSQQSVTWVKRGF
ncbi:unnamed protein product [Orchesella dallaii]|uniref:RING-type E3 ubiquitin transferase n=1 Tax=Orchesella dallaii TaxID=48710 RepID=A0ABP1QR97_9HEXA